MVGPAVAVTAPLGPLLVLTDRTQCTRPLVDVVAAAVDGGARAVVLREKDLPDDDRVRLRDALLPVLGDAVLVLAGPRLAGAAVHLAAADAVPAPRPALVGRSCHYARRGRWPPPGLRLGHRLAGAADGVSKPGYGPALGLAGLAACTGGPPVYALGGLGPAGRRRLPGGRCRGARRHGRRHAGRATRTAPSPRCWRPWQ